jgi:hypothetical protein
MLPWFALLGLGGGMNAAVLAVALLGLLLILCDNRSIGRLAAAFYGVKDAVAKTRDSRTVTGSGRLVGPLPVSTTDAIAARR